MGVSKQTEDKKVEYIGVSDRVGVRKNVTELLSHLDAGNLSSVVILFRTKDKTNRTFWNGKDEENVFMASLLISNIVNGQYVLDEDDGSIRPLEED